MKTAVLPRIMSTPRHRVPGRNCAGTHAYVLVGPTATGKSAVAQRLAERHGLSILSADSMLVYRGMDIGTAKPTPRERGHVPYGGMDLVSPGEPYSVGAYLKKASESFAAAQASRRPLVVVGGTGLYVAALIRGLDTPGAPPPDIRERVQAWFAEEGREGLIRRLRDMAPQRYQALDDPLNPRRLMRALELQLGGENPPSGWDAAPTPGVVGLQMDRADLARRILRRIRRMYDGGLLEEAAALRARVPELSETARGAIGYAEAFAVLDGGLTRDQAMERTATRTRQLAKRQMTWFRRMLNVSWVSVELDSDIDDVADQVLMNWEQTGPTPVRVESYHGA